MNVFEAERIVRAWWSDLARSPRSPLCEAARYQCLLGTIRNGLTETAAWTLYHRLGGGKERQGVTRRPGSKSPLTDTPVLTLLAALIDRREEYGVARPKVGVDQRREARHAEFRHRLRPAIDGLTERTRTG